MDTIIADLKVHTLQDIHTYKKDFKSHRSKCSPLGIEIKPYPNLMKRTTEYLSRRQQINQPYNNRTLRPRTRRRKRNLITFTPNRKVLSKPRKINVPVTAVFDKNSRGPATPPTPSHKFSVQNFNLNIKCPNRWKTCEDSTRSCTRIGKWPGTHERTKANPATCHTEGQIVSNNTSTITWSETKTDKDIPYLPTYCPICTTISRRTPRPYETPTGPCYKPNYQQYKPKTTTTTAIASASTT